MLKIIRIAAPVLMVLTAGMQFASAQQFNGYYSVGTTVDSSSNTQIDTFGTGSPFTTPRMGGLFSDFGASFMATKQFGAGADISWRDTQGAYAGLNYRPLFYNFDGIYQPVKTKRFAPELRLGLGGVHLGYSLNQTACNSFTGCSTATEGVGSSEHFQMHAEVAARFYVTNHIFVRPAVEAHWVNDFFQFGSNWVPQYSIGVGYSIGGGE
ncbi:MAG: hypothetical protein ABSB15_25425 [Bryobacteraceae bacterium]|jgi:hypothetical protein